MNNKNTERMDFRRKCIEHLVSEYRTKVDASDLGVWDKDRTKQYPHILKSRGLVSKMLIQQASSFVKEIDGFPLQSDAHHLNSSQLFCINMFQPLRKRACWDVLHGLLAVWGIALKGRIACQPSFEKVVCPKEKTHFDFYLETDQNERVFFEIKYTERDFASDPKKRRDAYYRNWLDYSQYLKGLSLDEFYAHYQIYRNISYVRSASDFVVFLFPHTSSTLVSEIREIRGLENMKNVCVANSETVVLDVHNALANLHRSSPRLSNHYKALHKRYFGWINPGGLA